MSSPTHPDLNTATTRENSAQEPITPNLTRPNLTTQETTSQVLYNRVLHQRQRHRRRQSHIFYHETERRWHLGSRAQVRVYLAHLDRLDRVGRRDAIALHTGDPIRPILRSRPRARSRLADAKIIRDRFLREGVERMDDESFEDKGWQCAICYEGKREEERDDDGGKKGDVVVKIKACGHVYHKECLGIWLESIPATGEATCPLCRAVLF
ncbi:hypothetical protein BDV96DRAFT_583929 [Lophiotrema nucula]|uniref:RING-type domain-containing protein n=1 Tax=Lophiotrema nucula TaxID=690887 RepID=A0A6A5YTD5_9PLEO|nr:hypothetical protein BDV96DRAFT_583929 [Lophiotrema nucula]